MPILQRGTGNTKGGAVSLSLDIHDLPDLISSQGVPAVNAEYFDRIVNRHDRHNGTWYGGLTSIQEAKNLILTGWTDGAQRAASVAQDDGLASALPKPESIRRRFAWAADGDDLDIDRALRGDWDVAYRSMPRTRTTGSKIVTLVSSFGGNCGKTAEQLFWSGAQMIVTAELLELAGYQTDVRGITFNDFHTGAGSGKKRLALDITCKTAGDPLRLDAIASVFAHAGVFRTYGFMGYCRATWNIGYGFGHALEDADAKIMFDDFVTRGLLNPADAFLPPAYSKDTAVRNILAALHSIQPAEATV